MTPLGKSVNCRGSPPDRGISHAWGFPVSPGLRKARERPSGEKRGVVSLGPDVKGTGSCSGMSIIIIGDRVSIDFLSTEALTNAKRRPSEETEGSPTVTRWYTTSGDIGLGIGSSSPVRAVARLCVVSIPATRPSRAHYPVQDLGRGEQHYA